MSYDVIVDAAIMFYGDSRAAPGSPPPARCLRKASTRNRPCQQRDRFPYPQSFARQTVGDTSVTDILDGEGEGADAGSSCTRPSMSGGAMEDSASADKTSSGKRKR